MNDPVRILILDRGHVWVCRCPEPQNFALWLPVTDARTIRRWGTTQGLAELVRGPLEGTQLDALLPTATVPVRAVLAVIDCEEEKWAAHLSRATPADSTTRRRS